MALNAKQQKQIEEIVASAMYLSDNRVTVSDKGNITLRGATAPFGGTTSDFKPKPFKQGDKVNLWVSAKDENGLRESRVYAWYPPKRKKGSAKPAGTSAATTEAPPKPPQAPKPPKPQPVPAGAQDTDKLPLSEKERIDAIIAKAKAEGAKSVDFTFASVRW